MQAAQRHRLAWLHAGCWQALQAGTWDDQARDCLAHWAAHDLPVIVTAQRHVADGHWALGLPAPSAWDRRRLPLQVPHAAIRAWGECPTLARLLASSAAPADPRWQALGTALAKLGAPTHVYGSRGWQCLTGLPYIHAHSDLDVWVGVRDTPHADAVAAALRQTVSLEVRCDGELVFPGGVAVNWREWIAWREGRSQSVLVRDAQGPRLVQSVFDVPTGPGGMESVS